MNDLLGQVFERLTVIEYAGRLGKYRFTHWKCKCTCGTVKIIRSSHLVAKRTLSCGCIQRERTKERFMTHGQYNTSEYRTWCHLRERCSNPNDKGYPNYGGRGISVCDRWKSFENFFADVGKRPTPSHTLDRIDNDGNYCPENCRWATWSQQMRNRRNTRMLTLHGETKCMTEWSQIKKIHIGTLWNRISKLGWTDEKALTTPVRSRRIS